jgi:hypothetical protein
MHYEIFKKIITLIAIIGIVGCGGNSSKSTLKDVETDNKKEILQNFPNDVTRQAIRLYSNSSNQSEWQVLREWPRGEIRIAVTTDKGQSWRELNFPGGSTVLLSQVVESVDALYLFTYDVQKNIPSGRSLRGVSEGIDLWRVDLLNSRISLIVQGLQLGGIDNLLTARIKEKAIDVCSINKCLNISLEGNVREWATGVPAGYELVELRFADIDAYALVRRTDEVTTGISDYNKPSYAVAILRFSNTHEKTTFNIVESNCLTFRLRWSDGTPNWSCAKTDDEIGELLLSDLQRIPHNGIGDIGLNNSEGRIAWGLTYQLNALLQLTDSNVSRLTAAADWTHAKEKLRGALDLVARQDSATEHGHSARRYSLDRSPQLFALHLGRIAHLLSEAEEAGFRSPEITRSLNIIKKQLGSLEDTVEVTVQEGKYATLGYRKGSAFWADGSNVPYNYISGYVLGLLSSGAGENDSVSRAKELMQPILEIENLAVQNLWKYWWGKGRYGWSNTDDVSINTPVYGGQTGTAHITYRSMDAMAILRLASVDPLSVDAAVIQNIRRLVANGYLLPFVNQELVRIGRAEKININVALRFARSAAPWELQAQIFALEALMAN